MPPEVIAENAVSIEAFLKIIGMILIWVAVSYIFESSQCVVKVEKGDLVACYVMNSSMEAEALMQYGIVLDTNPTLNDVLVLDNTGYLRWWNEKRWRVLQKTKKTLDS